MPSMDISAVVAEFGAKYTKGGQTDKDIKTALFMQSETEKYFNKVPESGTHYRGAYASIDEVLQAFSIPFVDKSTTTFSAIEYPLGEFKIDKTIQPDLIRKSWLGFLATIEEADRSKWPIIKWFIEKMLIPKSKEDFESAAAYYGWKITGYNGSPTVNGGTFVRELTADNVSHPANGGMDGLKTIFAKYISRMNTIATGSHSATPATFVDEIEAFMDAAKAAHPVLFKNCDFLFMNKTLYTRFIRGNMEKYNLSYAAAADLSEIQNLGHSIKVVGLDSHAGSEKIWMTPAMNRVMPVKTENTGRFDVQKDGRAVNILTDWSKCLAFDVPEFVITNDLDNTITAGDIATHY